jgi:prepilin-type N-terminal cleavage/methylation domain-containing protein
MKMAARGFTLIEISIVLVVVGLLTAGVLVGRDLVRAAEIRKQISSIESYDLAATTFRSKYNCLPGDCSKAEDFGLGTNGGPGENGDGDDMVWGGDVTYVVPLPVESINFWYHLSQAQMIESRFDGYPLGATNPWEFMGQSPAVAGSFVPGPVIPSANRAGIGGFEAARGGLFPLSFSAWKQDPNTFTWYASFFTDYAPLVRNKHQFMITAAFHPSGISGIWLPSIAHAIDSKIDDGQPLTGNTIAIQGLLIDGFSGAGDPPCFDPYAAPASYNIRQLNGSGVETPLNATNWPYLLCGLFVGASF